MAQSPARDLLLITDGKSFALDVRELARYGRQVSVVLIGEDSLEANVGHLSPLTGGEIFLMAGNDLTAVLTEALRSLRLPCSPPEPVSGVACGTSARRGGMTITASWSDRASATAPTIEMRGVTAVAASLLLAAVNTEDAAALAKREGLVTHLNGLVLVDVAGDIQQTVPATRNVPLPSPRTHMALARGVVRPSFSHGRTKAVVVEKVRRRSVNPGDGKSTEAAPSAPGVSAPRRGEQPSSSTNRSRRS